MRTRTVVALLVVVLALAGAVGYGLTRGATSGDHLTVEWVSDTGLDNRVNHHAPAVSTDAGMVFAPVSGAHRSTHCSLSALAATNGTTQWTYEIPRANCTIHAVADPTVADVDGDGTAEVLTATTERAVVGFDPRTGDEEFRYDLSTYGYTRPLVADLAGDDRPEVVVADVKGELSVVRPDGSAVWTRNLSTYTWAQPAVADFDGDEAPELAVGTEDALHVFERDGSPAWNATGLDGSITWMATGAVDGSGRDVVVATRAGTAALVDGATGEVEWEHSYARYAAVHAFEDGDGDGETEVYVVANDGTLRSIDAATGEVEWTTALTAESVQMMPPPALADLDGDGASELVAAANDGSVSVVDPASGDVLDSYERDVPIYTQPTIADVDGDGSDEAFVMYADGRVVAFSG